MFRSIKLAIATGAVALMAMSAQAGVGDYGVMWVDTLEDDGSEVSQNRFNTHGGVMTPSGYVSNAWIHQGGTNVWGGVSPTGQFAAVAGGFDAFGNNRWVDFSSDTGSGQQSYLRSIAYDPVNDVVAVGGYNRNDLENPADVTVQHNYYLRVIDNATGTQLVNKSFKTDGGAADAWQRAAHFDSSGTLFTAGYTRDNMSGIGIAYSGAGAADYDPIILKHNADGSVASSFIQQLSNLTDIPAAVQTDASGNIYLITNANGVTASGGMGDYDVVVQKFDSSFNPIAAFNGGMPLHIGSAGFDWATHAEFHPTTGDLIIATSINDDMALVSLNPTTGATNWTVQTDSSDNQIEEVSGLSFDEDGDIWIGGTTNGDLFGPNVSNDAILLAQAGNQTGDFFAAEFSAAGAAKAQLQWGTAGDDFNGSVKLGGTEQIIYLDGGNVGRDPADADPNDSPEYAWKGANVQPSNHQFNGWAVTMKYTAGDQNGDGYVDVDDIDDVLNNLFANTPAYDGDFDRDSDFDQDDADRFIQVIWETNYGDNDLDGDIDTGDITGSIINFTGAGVMAGKGWSDGNTDGDGDVDTGDITQSITNFTGASAGNPNVPDLVYDPATGNVTIDADGADVISFSLQSGPFNAADFSELPAGLTDNIASQIGWTSFNLFSGLTGTANLGAILPAGLDQAGLEAALTTASYGLALAGGGGGGRLDLIIPEPASMVLMGLGAVALVRRRRAA